MEKRFSSEEACAEYLAALRWPSGWNCRVAQPPRDRQYGATFGFGSLPYEVRSRLEPVSGQPSFLDDLVPRHVATATRRTPSVPLATARVGSGEYKTAWAMLHKLRRAMVRPGRDGLSGTVEVDETYSGTEESGLIGRLTMNKAIIAVAVEEDGRKIGRVWLKPSESDANNFAWLYRCIGQPGSTVRTDGFKSHFGLDGHPPTSRADRTARRRTRAASCASRHWTTETLVMGTHSRRGVGRASGRLSQRIHIPLQPPHLGVTRQTLLSIGTTSRSD